jgi:hypothetical protein
MLTVRIKKNSDGSSALTCLRADGTSAWQRQLGAQGRFFPHHDLTHFAVESELGFRRAFYGLVSEGWDFADFGVPWPRGPMPTEALAAEMIVGMLDVDRAMRARGDPPMTAAAITEQMIAYADAQGIIEPRPVLTDEQLTRIRARMSDLFAGWAELEPGGALELRFQPRRDSRP